MTQFEYLAVLISIIVGLGLSHLLSSAARLIQLRHRVRLYGPTLIWMATAFIAQIQIWWVAFERRTTAEWTFFSFLLYLLIPIGAYVLSYLVVPDLEGAEVVDLKASYYANRIWLFGILTALLAVSLSEEYVRTDEIPQGTDALFRLVFLLLAVAGMWIRREAFHVFVSTTFLVLFGAYIFDLFLRLG